MISELFPKRVESKRTLESWSQIEAIQGLRFVNAIKAPKVCLVADSAEYSQKLILTVEHSQNQEPIYVSVRAAFEL
jgi:hypothetical protein